MKAARECFRDVVDDEAIPKNTGFTGLVKYCKYSRFYKGIQKFDTAWFPLFWPPN